MISSNEVHLYEVNKKGMTIVREQKQSKFELEPECGKEKNTNTLKEVFLRIPTIKQIARQLN